MSVISITLLLLSGYKGCQTRSGHSVIMNYPRKKMLNMQLASPQMCLSHGIGHDQDSDLNHATFTGTDWSGSLWPSFCKIKQFIQDSETGSVAGTCESLPPIYSVYLVANSIDFLDLTSLFQ